MSTLKVNNLQVGQDATATNNFTWYQPASPDGTIRLGVGNASATSSDPLTVTSTGLLGIGTNNPEQHIHVKASYATIEVENTNTTQYAGAYLALTGVAGTERSTILTHSNLNSGGTESYFQIAQNDSSGGYVKTIAQYSYEYDYWAFHSGTAGAERLRITSDGHVYHSGPDGRRYSFANDGSAHYLKYDATLDGIVLNGYGAISFETNGPTERVRINSVGQTTINCTSNQQLILNNPTLTGQTSIGFQENGVTKYIIGHNKDTDSNMDFYIYDQVNNRHRLNITDIGNVGINVDAPVTAQLEVVNEDFDNKATVRFGGANTNLGDLYLIRSRDDTNVGLGYTAQAWAINVENSVNSDNKLVQRGLSGGITTAAAMALSADDPAGADHGAFTVYTTGGNGAAGAILSPKFRVAYDGAVTIQSETSAEVSGTTRGPTLCLSDTNNETTFALKDTHRRPMIYLSGSYPEITLCGDEVTNTRHGPTMRWVNGNPGTTAATGNQFVMGTNGTGTQLDIGYATAAANTNIHNGIDNYNGTTLFRVDSANNAVKAAGHVIQVGYARYDPNSDSYTVVAGQTKSRSAVYLDFTPKYANSSLLILTRMHTRIIAAVGCSYGIDVSGDSGANWTALDGMVQRNAMDFFYKSDAVNHHYTGFCLTYISATDTNSRRYAPWGQGWGSGQWEISYGHGEHSVTVYEIAGTV